MDLRNTVRKSLHYLLRNRSKAALSFLALTALVVPLILARSPPPPDIDQLPVRGNWTHTADAPIIARDMAVTAWNGSEILVIGGTLFVCPPNALCMPPPGLSDGAAYNPTNDTWRRIADSPFGLVVAEVATVQEDLFILARGSSGLGTQNLLRYESAPDSWTEIDLPESVDWTSIEAFGDFIVLYSFTDERGTVGDWLFDTTSESWQRLPDDPLGEGFSRQFLAHGDDLYLFDHALVPSPGGASGPSFLRAARWRNRQWTTLPTSDSIGSAPSLIAGGLLIAAQLGCADGGNTNNYGRCIPFGAVFDTTTDSWRELPNAPGGSARYIGYSGGIGDSGVVLQQAGQPAFDARSGEWFRMPALDTDAMTERAVRGAGPYGFVFGGTRHSASGSELLNEAWIWKP